MRQELTQIFVILLCRDNREPPSSGNGTNASDDLASCDAGESIFFRFIHSPRWHSTIQCTCVRRYEIVLSS